MTLDRKFLATIRCPVSKRALRLLKRRQLDRLNAAIADGKVHYADGRRVDKALSAGLITDNSTTIYRIDDAIPVMFEDDSIPVAQLDDSDSMNIGELFND